MIRIPQTKHAIRNTSDATILMHVFLSVGDVMEMTTVIEMKTFMIHLMRKIVVSCLTSSENIVLDAHDNTFLICLISEYS